MGNCLPKPISSLPSATKLWTTTTPAHSDRKSSNNNKSSSNTSPRTSSRNSPARKTEDNRDVIVREAEPKPEPEPEPMGRIVTPNLKMYTFSELKSATRNFRPDTVLGEGGFGRVFKGWVDEKTLAPSKIGFGIPVAVKKSNPDSDQGLKEWQSEVKFLGKFSHPNLVKLLGYCWEERQFLLVYEYMQKGSLESHLFRKGAEQLSWEKRLKIAIGAARGLSFLHATGKQVIYRDFKTANILLDGELNAKLSDFGLAKLGPTNGDSHVSTQVVGTYGYAAPEYMATGHLYVRSDVYGFGVVLLEILTGLRVLDTNRPSGEHNLVEWAKPFLSDKRKLKRIMDRNLEDLYPIKAAFEVAALILKCLEADPKNRPCTNEVLETLEHIITIKITPKGSKASTEQRGTNNRHSNNYRSPLHPTKNGNVGAGNGARRGGRSPARPRW